MSKVTMRQITELFHQIKMGKITGEAMQELIENADKLHLRKIFQKHMKKAGEILEKSSKDALLHAFAVKEFAIAHAIAGNFKEARVAALKIAEAKWRSEAFLGIALESHSSIDLDNARQVANEIEDELGWRKVKAFLDIAEVSGGVSDIHKAQEIARTLPDPTPQTNSEDNYCLDLAIAVFKLEGHGPADLLAKRAGKMDEFLAEVAKIFVGHWNLEEARKEAAEISDPYCRADAYSCITLANKSEEDLGKLRNIMSEISPEHGGGFAHAYYAGVLADLREKLEAYKLADSLFPSARSEAFQHIAEALANMASKEDMEPIHAAIKHADLAGNEYNARELAFKAIALAIIRAGELEWAREVAEWAIPHGKVYCEVFETIGRESRSDGDFRKAYAVIQDTYKKPEVGKAEALAKLCQAIAFAMK